MTHLKDNIATYYKSIDNLLRKNIGSTMILYLEDASGQNYQSLPV